MVLQLSNICKHFGVDEILKDVSLSVNDRGRAGIIGPNGAGKTTLLNIIAGSLPYDGGSRTISKDSKIGFLKQTGGFDSKNTIWQEMCEVFSDVYQLEQDMRALEAQMADCPEGGRPRLMEAYAKKQALFEQNDGFAIHAKIQTVLNGMGFSGFDTSLPVKKLSGGEKTKLKMAKLLLEEPDLLLLDEPTNHLDFATMQWLEGYLKTYRGAILAVSHDRYFLDAMAAEIYEVDRCTVKRYTGNYSAYLIQKEENYQFDMKHYEKQQREIHKLEDYVARNLVRASTTKQAQSRRKVLEKMDVLERPSDAVQKAHFAFMPTYPSYQDVLDVEDLSLFVTGENARTLCEHITFSIKRGEKAALIGANGIGKSTLLKTLLGIHKHYRGRFQFGRNADISYYDQELGWLCADKTPFDEVYDRFPRMTEREIRTLLGGMQFHGDDVYKPIRALSGGEKAKLAFLIIMLEKRNTLLLDEPTNHLDLMAKEALDAALMDFSGTVLFVSHDRYFLNKVADKVLELTPDGVKVFCGNYDYYLEKKDVFYQTPKTDAPAEKKANTYQEEKRRAAAIRTLKRKLDQCEADISQADEAIAALQKELAEAGADYEAAQEIMQRIEACEMEQRALYEQLELLEDAWEGMDA